MAEPEQVLIDNRIAHERSCVVRNKSLTTFKNEVDIWSDVPEIISQQESKAGFRPTVERIELTNEVLFITGGEGTTSEEMKIDLIFYDDKRPHHENQRISIPKEKFPCGMVIKIKAGKLDLDLDFILVALF